MSHKGLIPPASPTIKDRKVTVRVTEDEWESIKENRRNSCDYDLIGRDEAWQEASTADLDTEDYHPFEDGAPTAPPHHRRCTNAEHVQPCETCTL
jgi:hypothetical protein